MNKKMDETSRSTKEDNRTLKEEFNNKMDETSRSTKEELSRNIGSLKEELNNKINETNRRMEDGQKKTEELLEKKICLLYTSRCV